MKNEHELVFTPPEHRVRHHVEIGLKITQKKQRVKEAIVTVPKGFPNWFAMEEGTSWRRLKGGKWCISVKRDTVHFSSSPSPLDEVSSADCDRDGVQVHFAQIAKPRSSWDRIPLCSQDIMLSVYLFYRMFMCMEIGRPTAGICGIIRCGLIPVLFHSQCFSISSLGAHLHGKRSTPS